MITLAWLACVEPAPDAAAAGAVLSDPAYRFCHEPGYDKAAAEEWCDLLADVPPERCPALVETCAGAEDPGRGCEAGGASGGDPDGLAGSAERPDRPMSCDAELPSPDLLRWVLAAAAAAVVVVLLRLAMVSFGTGGDRRRRLEVPGAPVEELPAVEVPDAPAVDQLAAARTALAEERFADVVVLARGAALRALGERGRLVLHRSRTDREYARALRGDPQANTDLGVVVRAHERARFGGRDVDRSVAEAALAAAGRLLLVLVSVIGLGSGEARAQGRYGPRGDAALVSVLTAHGYDAGYRLRGLTELDEETDALVLDLSGLTPDADDWEAVRAWVVAGGVLVVAGDASAGFPELGTCGAPTGEVLEPQVVPAWSRALPAPSLPGGPSAVWRDGAGRSLVDAPGGSLVVELDQGLGVVVGVADARLLWNAAFVSAENEAFVGDLLYTGQSLEGWPLPTPARVQLATTAAVSDPSDDPNPFRSVANARLLPFVLQLILAWVVLGLWRGWPFGPMRDPTSDGRDRFVEHVRALGSQWAAARSSGWASRAYAALWWQRLGAERLRAAATRAGSGPEQADAFVREVERRATAADAPDTPEDLGWMDELWRVTKAGREGAGPTDGGER